MFLILNVLIPFTANYDRNQNRMTFYESVSKHLNSDCDRVKFQIVFLFI